MKTTINLVKDNQIIIEDNFSELQQNINNYVKELHHAQEQYSLYYLVKILPINELYHLKSLVDGRVKEVEIDECN